MLLVLGVCVISCDDNNSIPNAHFETSASIVGKVLPYEVISNYPSQLEIIDSTLLLFRPNAMIALMAVNITNGAQYNMLHTGRGPGEFLSPFLVKTAPAERLMGIYDITHRKLTYCEWDETFFRDTIRLRTKNELMYSGEIPLRSTVPLDNGYMVSRSIGQTEGVLLVLDKDFNMVSSLCNPLNIGNTEDWRSYLGQFASYGNTVIFAMMQFGYILCFDIENDGTIRKRWEYLLSDPKFIESPEFKPDILQNKLGFYDVKVTGRFVYALYSGKIFDNPPDNSELPTSILVFDLDGHPITKFELDSSFVRIAVTQDDSKIYGFSVSGDIVCYELDEI